MSSCKEPTPWADRWAAVEAHCADMRDEGQLLMVEELLETLVESQRFSAASHTLQDRIEQLVLLEAGGWEVVNKDGGTDMLEALRDAQEMLSSREEEIEALHGYCKQHLLMTRLYKQVKADMANICERLQSLPCSPNGGMCATEEERFLRPQWLVQRVGETLTVQATALENLRAANDEFQKEVDRAEKAYKVLQDQLTSERASWRECLTKLEVDVRQLQTENGELHSNGERLCTANERMEAELAALQQELATLGAAKEEAAASYQQRVADLEDAGQQLRADAEAQLLRSAAEAAELEERLSELLVQKALDVTTLQGEIARLEAEADRLQREHAEASQAAAQEAVDLRQQLERLREEERETWRHLEVATAQRDRSEEEAVKLQDRCEQLEQKLTTQVAERTQLQGPPTRIAVAAGAVVPPATPRRPSSSRAVQALDAADGVLDGTYFGRPIVEVAGTQFLRPRYEAVERFDEWPYADPVDVQAVYDTGLRWYYVRPEEHFIRVVESIDQYVPAAGPGHYELHPWLGVTLKWLDDLDQGGRDNVAVVQQVQRGSPAWKAGLRPGDQLEYWGDTKIDSAATWKAKVRLLRIGDVIDFGIHRDRRDQRVAVRVEGTTKHRGSRNRIRSASGAHTDNY